ncbi:MAG: hypothetical protein MUC92_00510 [Fimbriimonadaceae bacterium]|nr:hypothetical protein [Fimbriimonadaceae bacterium]
MSDRSFALKTPNEELYTGVFTSNDSIDTIAKFYTERVKGLEFNKSENAGAVSMFSKELFDDRKGKQSVTLLRKSADAPVEISLAWGKTK